MNSHKVFWENFWTLEEVLEDFVDKFLWYFMGNPLYFLGKCLEVNVNEFLKEMHEGISGEILV